MGSPLRNPAPPCTIPSSSLQRIVRAPDDALVCGGTVAPNAFEERRSRDVRPQSVSTFGNAVGHNLQPSSRLFSVSFAFLCFCRNLIQFRLKHGRCTSDDARAKKDNLHSHAAVGGEDCKGSNQPALFNLRTIIVLLDWVDCVRKRSGCRVRNGAVRPFFLGRVVHIDV